MSAHMGKERELLAKRQMLEQEANKKWDELEIIFQKRFEIRQAAYIKFDEFDAIINQIKDIEKKIEEQREKQIIVNTRVLEEPW